MLDNKKITIIKTIIIIVVLIIIKIIGKEMQINIKTKEMQEQNYIQNLEEKLNIYEKSYEEFCLEDSLKQSDAYGQ